MPARPNQQKTKRACYLAHVRHNEAGRPYLVCHACGLLLDPATQAWEADHIKRHAEYRGPDADDPSNVFPLCMRCARVKNPKDAREIAKGKRIGEKRVGIKGRGFRRPEGVKFDWSEGRYRRTDDE